MFRSARVCRLRPAFRPRPLGSLRQISTSSESKPLQAGFGKASAILAVGILGLGLLSIDARSALNEYLWCPLIRAITDAEGGHNFGINALKYGLYPRAFGDYDDPSLKVTVFGKTLANPVGMAAGFDKQGEVMDELLSLGFGTVEIGTITPKPQIGNPKPRFFRLNADSACINRYGINSDGSFDVVSRLRVRFEKYLNSGATKETNALVDGKLLFVNIGMNKGGDSSKDYVAGVDTFAPYADALVLNVSCPNVEGARDIQDQSLLGPLLKSVRERRDQGPTQLINSTQQPPILVKVSPDLTEGQIKGVAQAAKDAKIDGIIMSNTTTQRPASLISSGAQKGGLSGPPLKEIALKSFRTLHKYTKDSDLVLIGCGGISSGKDAIEFAKAGATLIELHTAFGFKGPGLPYRIKDEIAQELKKEGKTWMEIVGTDN